MNRMVRSKPSTIWLGASSIIPVGTHPQAPLSWREEESKIRRTKGEFEAVRWPWWGYPLRWVHNSKTWGININIVISHTVTCCSDEAYSIILTFEKGTISS